MFIIRCGRNEIIHLYIAFDSALVFSHFQFLRLHQSESKSIKSLTTFTTNNFCDLAHWMTTKTFGHFVGAYCTTTHHKSITIPCKKCHPNVFTSGEQQQSGNEIKQCLNIIFNFCKFHSRLALTLLFVNKRNFHLVVSPIFYGDEFDGWRV